MLEVLSERLSCVGFLDIEDFFTWSCEYEISSFIATFWTNVDNRIRIGDNVEVMFDHDDTIPFLNEGIENIEQFLNIRKMKSCCWLIENIEGFSCRTFGEIESELDTLSFSSRESWSRLTEFYIPETNLLENIEDSSNSRKCTEKLT